MIEISARKVKRELASRYWQLYVRGKSQQRYHPTNRTQPAKRNGNSKMKRSDFPIGVLMGPLS